MNVNCYHSEKRLESHRNSWMCYVHSVSGKKSEDELSPNYVPTIFDHIVSSLKGKAKLNLVICFLHPKYSLLESTLPLKVDSKQNF